MATITRANRTSATTVQTQLGRTLHNAVRQ